MPVTFGTGGMLDAHGRLAKYGLFWAAGVFCKTLFKGGRAMMVVVRVKP
jgi:hypothetical protein